MIVCVTALVEEKTTVQLATPTVAVGVSVQGSGANVPLCVLLQSTVPVGVVFVPAPVSETVAVQLVEPPAWKLPSWQATVVRVGRLARRALNAT